MAEYSYTLDPAEILRYRMMASRALDREADLWDAAGITSNAAVVDLGCGPGIFLPELASRTAPAGRLVGVDESGPAVTAARQRTGQIDQLDLGVRIQIVQARAHATAYGQVVSIRDHPVIGERLPAAPGSPCQWAALPAARGYHRALNAGVPFRDVQETASHADPGPS